MNALPPSVDPRDQEAVLRDLLRKTAGFTPGWEPRQPSSGAALAHIFARFSEIFLEGLNQAPDRHFLAFLSTLGESLLPAQPARAPLVFTLMDNSPVDVPLPANSLVAAPPQPNPPSPLLEEASSEDAEPKMFATTQTITLTRAKLAAIYSLQPGTDEYSNHLPQAVSGFRLFDDLQLIEHAIYLGHDSLFALAGEAEIRFSVASGPLDLSQAAQALEIEWEYLSKDGWLPLEVEDDRTLNLSQGGQLILRKSCGPDSKEEEISGHTSYWVRGKLNTPLLPQSSPGTGRVPLLDTIQARVGFVKSGLLPEAAFVDAFSVDTNNNFYPFGQQPARYTTFYLASEEVFQRREARVALQFTLSEAGDPSDSLSLVWEYHDGVTWQRLDTGFDFQDGTESFTRSGDVTILSPPDWEKATVNGEENYWLRVRINQGNYGHPLRLSTEEVNGSYTVQVEESTLAPPVVSRLTLQYTYQTQSFLLDHCLTFNDFVFTDHTEDSRWLRRTFQPFRPVADTRPAVYFGFDQPLPSGLISLYLHIASPPSDAASQTNDLIWEYRSERGWSELGVLDHTQGFRYSGLIQWIGQRDALPEAGLNGDLYRIRARLIQGQSVESREVAGVWMNAVWGTQRLVFEREVLGTSNGSPMQTFSFLRHSGPILEGELIEVREWSGRGEGWQTAVQDIPEADLRFETDPVTQEVLAVWVRWHNQPYLFSSGPDERHYVLERSTGMLRFGDDVQGRIPPAGSRVAASYSSGGGLGGNVPPGAINELRTGVPYIMGVTNPVAAEGGAATEELRSVRGRGPQALRHRSRALTTSDIEWLARQASPAVAQARCLPLTGPDGKAQRGWFSLVVVPYSEADQPLLTAEIQRRVRLYLAERVPATTSDRIRILSPEYTPVKVIAEVKPADPDEASKVEARLRQNLNAFLHPLTGGPEGDGWRFGQPVYLSQVAHIIETTEGVDYAGYVGLRVGEQIFDEYVPVEENRLISTGDHELKLTLGGG